jgi:hypothetical protein
MQVLQYLTLYCLYRIWICIIHIGVQMYNTHPLHSVVNDWLLQKYVNHSDFWCRILNQAGHMIF